MNMENIVGQPHKQLVSKRAHLGNTKKKYILNRWWASLPSISLCHWGQRDMDMHYKQLIDFQYSQQKSNCLHYNSNYTRRTLTWKILWVSPSASSSVTANSSGEGPTHLGIFFKININNFNIMGWLFPLLVWNRPSSSSCRKGPAHLENSARED